MNVAMGLATHIGEKVRREWIRIRDVALHDGAKPLGQRADGIAERVHGLEPGASGALESLVDLLPQRGQSIQVLDELSDSGVRRLGPLEARDEFSMRCVDTRVGLE